MLDAVIDYLPSPLDVKAIVGHHADNPDEEVVAPPDDDADFAALAFKVMTDPYVGKLTFFRVYSGTLNSGSYVKNSTKDKRERVGRLLQMHANTRKEISTVYSGDIAAAVGLKETGTGDTLCGEKNDIILESMEFPEPVIHLSVEPKSKADQDKMTQALVKLQEEDPTFHAHTDEETGQVIIGGMGELHLDILVDRMKKNLTLKLTLVRQWFHTVKHSKHQLKFKVNSLVNLVVVVNMVMFILNSHLTKSALVSNSKTLSSVV